MVISPTASLGAAICRICHGGETPSPTRGSIQNLRARGEPLISPCHCKGTMGLYHRSCVERWLSVSNSACCEICKFQFQLERKNPSFWAFGFGGCGGLYKRQGKKFFANDLFTIMSIPFFVVCAYLSTKAGLNATYDYYPYIGEWDVLVGILWLLLAALCMSISFIVLYVTVEATHERYQLWRRKNQVLCVVDQLSLNESIRFNGDRRPLPVQWISKFTSFTRDLTRRRRRPSPDISVTYIPRQIMEDAERAVGSAGENRGRFTVTPVNGSHTAGHNVQYPANVYAEISPLAVVSLSAPSSSSVVPRPLVPDRHPSPPSAGPSFSCSPELGSGRSDNISSGGFLHVDPYPSVGPYTSTPTRTFPPVVAASDSLQPPRNTDTLTPLYVPVSTASYKAPGGFYSAPPAVVATADQRKQSPPTRSDRRELPQ